MLVLFAALLVLFFVADAWRPYYPEPYIKELKTGWEYSLDGQNYTPVSLPCRVKNLPPDSTVFLRTVLKDDYPHPALLVKGEHQKMVISLGPEEIFSSETFYPTNTRNPGLYKPIVYLPVDYLNKELTIAISSPYPFFQGSLNNVYIGRNSTLVGFGLTECNYYIVLSMFAFLLGLIFIVFYLYDILDNKESLNTPKMINLILALFCFTTSFFLTTHSQIIHMFYNALQLSFIVLISLYILKLPLLFLCSQIRKSLVSYSGIIAASLFVVAALLLRSFTHWDLPMLFPFYLGLAWITSFMVLGSLFYETYKNNELAKSYLIVFVPFLLFETLFIIQYYNTGINTSSHYLVVGLLIFLAGSFFIQIREMIRGKIDLETSNQMLALKSDLAFQQLSNMYQTHEEILEIKHDIRNYLALLHEYLSKNQHLKALLYLEDLRTLYLKTDQLITTNNQLVDIILNDRIARADALNIRFECDINIPADLKIPDRDLSSILTNLLDNSIEACSLLPDPIAKVVKFTCKVKNDFLYISTWNPKSHSIIIKDADIITTKAEDRVHGFGLKIIKKTVDSLDGIVSIDYDETSFSISLVLPLP